MAPEQQPPGPGSQQLLLCCDGGEGEALVRVWREEQGNLITEPHHNPGGSQDLISPDRGVI